MLDGLSDEEEDDWSMKYNDLFIQENIIGLFSIKTKKQQFYFRNSWSLRNKESCWIYFSFSKFKNINVKMQED